MKFLAFTAVQLMATAAMACPNLSGKYKCEQPGPDGEIIEAIMDIKQEGNVYTIDVAFGDEVIRQEIIADGKERLSQFSDAEVEIYDTNSCLGNKLVSKSMQVYKGKGTFAPTTSISSYKVDNIGFVRESMDTTYFPSGSEIDISTEVCDRI